MFLCNKVLLEEPQSLGGGAQVTWKAVVLVGVAVVLMASSNSVGAPKFGDWSTPVNLGPVINGVDGDFGPAISKHGLSLFFSSFRTPSFGAQDTWVSQRASEDDPWGPPVNLGPTVNTAFRDGAPSLSRDEHWLFISSDRPGGFGDDDVWASYRKHVHDDFGWQTPVNLGPGVNSATVDQGAGYFENDDVGVPLLYFSRGAAGAADIYVSAQLPDGSWGAAELVAELSSPAADLRPIPRFDGLELFLMSNRPGSLLFDIWVSTRDAVSDPWGTPVNLGATVNSPSSDQQAYLASDRRTLYFSSNRPGGAGGNDLYVTTRVRA